MTKASPSYAHTRRDFLNLVNEIQAIAAGNPAGKDIGISATIPMLAIGGRW